jgi:hypothetical protein
VPQPAAIPFRGRADIQSIARDGFLTLVNEAGKVLPNQSLNWIDLFCGMAIRQSRKFSEKTFNISNYCAGIRRRK